MAVEVHECNRIINDTSVEIVMVDPLKVFWILTNSSYLGKNKKFIFVVLLEKKQIKKKSKINVTLSIILFTCIPHISHC